MHFPKRVGAALHKMRVELMRDRPVEPKTRRRPRTLAQLGPERVERYSRTHGISFSDALRALRDAYK